MGKKIRVGILFGGRSAEHEVSLHSAKNIVDAIDKEKYEIVLLGIDKKGRWYLNESSMFLLQSEKSEILKIDTKNENVAVVPGKKNEVLVSLSQHKSIGALDVVFPVLHGPYGEDGTIQGLLKLADIPFVGASVTGSAIGMDKDVMKRLLRDAGIPVPKFAVFSRSMKNEIKFEKVREFLGMPVFVKPANLGSSVGINKASNEEQFEFAILDAFKYDNKIIIEESIKGREIECSVLGNEHPIASLPGEIIPHHDFYSYDAKYLDDKGANLDIPAKLSPELTEKIQNLAVQSFKVLCCEGMARVDFFLRGDEIFVNEINTIPGFTKISMYPKLWEASGISYKELIDRLIQLALDRFEAEKQLKTSYNHTS